MFNYGFPRLKWSEIQTEVTQMIRSEIAQLTATKTVRATSSPIESRDKLTARRHLVSAVLVYLAQLDLIIFTVLRQSRRQ